MQPKMVVGKIDRQQQGSREGGRTLSARLQEIVHLKLVQRHACLPSFFEEVDVLK